MYVCTAAKTTTKTKKNLFCLARKLKHSYVKLETGKKETVVNTY